MSGIPRDSPRVDALIERVMAQHPGLSDKAQARYYEEVHQELAPLARSLEREVQQLRAERDEWAAKWQAVRRELAELKFPGANGLVAADNGGAMNLLPVPPNRY